MKTTIEFRLAARRAEVETALRQVLPRNSGVPQILRRAMSYSLFAGGKRVRPALLLESCEAVGGDRRQAVPAACALELIHTYSLIHDDLPCMDDADERRGRPTSHKIFGEANAVLSGDGLLTLAFHVLGREQIRAGVSPEAALEVTSLIADAAGGAGMVGGQVLDLQWVRQEVGAAQLRKIHRMKTGALIRASVEAGAIIGGATPARRKHMRDYGEAIGLAFQIVDDLLDVAGNSAALGKSTQDAQQGKITFPKVFGIERSRKLARRAADEAVSCLASLGPRAEPLRQLADFIVLREN